MDIATRSRLSKPIIDLHESLQFLIKKKPSPAAALKLTSPLISVAALLPSFLSVFFVFFYFSLLPSFFFSFLLLCKRHTTSFDVIYLSLKIKPNEPFFQSCPCPALTSLTGTFDASFVYNQLCGCPKPKEGTHSAAKVRRMSCNLVANRC